MFMVFVRSISLNPNVFQPICDGRISICRGRTINSNSCANIGLQLRNNRDTIWSFLYFITRGTLTIYIYSKLKKHTSRTEDMLNQHPSKQPLIFGLRFNIQKLAINLVLRWGFTWLLFVQITTLTKESLLEINFQASVSSNF